MKRILALLFFLTGALYSFAQTPYNEIWTRANKLYQQKDFKQAAALYEHLAAQKPDEAEVYYNLGNAYYRLNKIGAAVLSYRRALKIDPGYQAAQDNLELTESRIPNRVQQAPDIFFVSWWKGITGPQLAEVWAICALLLFILSIIILSLRRLQRAPAWMRPYIAVIGVTLSALFIICAYTAGQRKAATDEAVVMDHDAPLMEKKAAVRSNTVIPEGTVVSILAEQADMLEVQLPDGRSGWMNKQLLQRI